MVERMLVLLPCLALTGCIPFVMPAPGGTQPAGGSPSTSEASPQDPSSASPTSEPSSEAKSEPAGPAVVSVTIRSSCKENVRVFFGDKPKFGSGTTSSISSNSVSSRQMKEGDMVWIVDGSDNPIASVSIQKSTSKIEVDGSCKSWR